MKQRDEPLALGGVQIVHTLVIPTAGGNQKMNWSKEWKPRKSLNPNNIFKPNPIIFHHV